MAKLNEVKIILNKLVPLNLSDCYIKEYGGYDNSGLLVGDLNKEIKKILLCLDVTTSAIEKAILNEIDLIISHHPFIYSKISNTTNDNVKGKQIQQLIKNDIAVYSMHLCLDALNGGVSHQFAKAIGLKCSNEYVFKIDGKDAGVGVICSNEKRFTLEEMKEKVSNGLQDRTVYAVGDSKSIPNKIAVIGGSGGDDQTMQQALSLGCDAIISSEFKHHILVEAVENNVGIISASHYFSEVVCLNMVQEMLNNGLKGMDVLIDREFSLRFI